MNDLLRRRRAMMASNVHGEPRLPEEYQEVTWLQTDGRQAIRLNAHISSSNVKVDFVGNVTESGGMRPIFMACGGRDLFFIPIGIYGGRTYRWFSSSQTTRDEWENIGPASSGVTLDTVTVEFDYDSKTRIGYVNGIKTVESTYTTDIAEEIADNSDLWMFTWTPSPNAPSMNGRFYGKCHSLAYSENGIIKIDLVSCYRKADLKPGMYDIVSGAFYINQSDYEFEVGPDIN